MNEWGIPDWQDPDSYGDVMKWSENRWRWEFVRRREDVRNAFDQAQVCFDGDRARRHELASQLGYVLLPNPRIGSLPEELVECWATDDAIRIGEQSEELPDSVLEVHFDLEKPLNPQLEQTKKLLLASQRERFGKPIGRKRHPKKWLNYLRVIDARDSHVPYGMIADILRRTAKMEQTVRNVEDQARALCFKF